MKHHMKHARACLSVPTYLRVTLVVHLSQVRWAHPYSDPEHNSWEPRGNFNSRLIKQYHMETSTRAPVLSSGKTKLEPGVESSGPLRCARLAVAACAVCLLCHDLLFRGIVQSFPRVISVDDCIFPVLCALVHNNTRVCMCLHGDGTSQV